ncbi:hypothetical protein [Vibrio sp. 10N.247.311.51]|uniref:hypothetical protein n=1 Tax=Vibrio sp. 10N.247.311.51 TaxID=3229996 RepID=UPI00355016D5
MYSLTIILSIVLNGESFIASVDVNESFSSIENCEDKAIEIHEKPNKTNIEVMKFDFICELENRAQ